MENYPFKQCKQYIFILIAKEIIWTIKSPVPSVFLVR